MCYVLLMWSCLPLWDKSSLVAMYKPGNNLLARITVYNLYSTFKTEIGLNDPHSNLSFPSLGMIEITALLHDGGILVP